MSRGDCDFELREFGIVIPRLDVQHEGEPTLDAEIEKFDVQSEAKSLFHKSKL